MKYTKISRILLVLVMVAGVSLRSDTRDIEDRRGAPHLTAVEPGTGKVSDLVTASGKYLDKSRVRGLYLSDAKTDVKVEITEQSEGFIRFKIPAEAKPGRYRLTILMVGSEPIMLEQPVFLTVEQ